MRNYILYLNLFLVLIFFPGCKKEAYTPEEEKQYLFDGLPYYLTDTLFNERTYPDILQTGIKNIEFDSKGFAWLLDAFDQLYRYDPASKELIWWSKEDIIGNDYPITLKNFFVDSRDRIWGNCLGKLYLFEGTSLKTINFPTSVWGGNMAEDKEGNIHFHGSDLREHVCDGETVTDVVPVFAPDDYLVYSIFNDSQRNLWYKIDLYPEDNWSGLAIVRYSSEDDYKIMSELPNIWAGGNISSANLAFDSDNNAYLESALIIYRVSMNDDWDTVYIRHWTEDIDFDKLYTDHEDNLWSALSPSADIDDPLLIAFVKDGEYITESLNAKVIQNQIMVLDICFPDNNTVWVCTTGGVFEFKK